MQLSFYSVQFVARSNHFRPDIPVERGQGFVRSALQQQFPLGNDGHARTKLPHVIHNVSRQNHRAVTTQRREQIEEAIALRRIQPRRRFVDNDQPRIAQQSLRNSETLLHAARKSRKRFLTHIPQIRLLQQGVDNRLALARRHHALHNGQMMQHVERRYLRIHSELLRQVAQDPANLIFLPKHVDAIKIDAARVGILQRGNRTHQRTFSRAVRPHQPEHTVADRK